MKHNRILVFVTAFILCLAAASCSKGEWAAKIDNDVITIDDFYRYYYAQNKLLLNKSKSEVDELSQDPALKEHPTLGKNNFMDFLVSRKLLYKKALSDKSLPKKELNIVDELFTLQGVATYYLTEKLKEQSEVNDAEVENFYRTNKSLFKGVPINNDIIERIRQQLLMQKFEQKSSEFVMELVAESKVVRDGFQKYMKQMEKQKNDADAKDAKDARCPEAINRP
jgi:hypothetical protein